MIRVGIVGATGYGGREFLRLLGLHPGAEPVALTSTTEAGKDAADLLPAFRSLVNLSFETFDAEKLAASCDVVVIGAPATESMGVVAALRKSGARVIDLGPDFRLQDTAAFAEYYGAEHSERALLEEAVYGLVPFAREGLAAADLVAVPGCYPIGSILPLKPLVAAANPSVPVVIDAISGLSGAGRSLSDDFHFSEMNENVWAYKLGVHQHTPEIEQELEHRVKVQFSPHVGPYTRGILSTITLRPENDIDVADRFRCYDAEPFVRVLGEGNLPKLNQIQGSNFCDIGWVNDRRTGNIVLVSALDNLVAGTAGMAMHCMNLMFGLEETTGLTVGGMSV